MHLNNEYILIPSFIVIRIPPQCSHFIQHENKKKQFISKTIASSTRTFIAPPKGNDLEEHFFVLCEQKMYDENNGRDTD
jgi:hypothetical protein